MLRRCNIKKVFGKTIHKNMSASDLKAVWDIIPKDKKKDFPELTSLISAAVMAEKVASEAISKYEIAKKALEAQKEVVLGAAASTAGNPTYSITKAAEATAKKAIQQAAQSAIDKVKSATETLMNKMLEAGGCREEDENTEKNPETKPKNNEF